MKRGDMIGVFLAGLIVLVVHGSGATHEAPTKPDSRTLELHPLFRACGDGYTSPYPRAGRAIDLGQRWAVPGALRMAQLVGRSDKCPA